MSSKGRADALNLLMSLPGKEAGTVTLSGQASPLEVNSFPLPRGGPLEEMTGGADTQYEDFESSLRQYVAESRGGLSADGGAAVMYADFLEDDFEEAETAAVSVAEASAKTVIEKSAESAAMSRRGDNIPAGAGDASADASDASAGAGDASAGAGESLGGFDDFACGAAADTATDTAATGFDEFIE